MEKKGPWLCAWRDPVAGIKSYTNLIRTADVHGDGDYKLIIADLSGKLFVYKGVNIEWEHNLIDNSPIAVCVFYSNDYKNCKLLITIIFKFY